MTTFCLRSAAFIFVGLILFGTNVHAQIERFTPFQGGGNEVWRLTHDPASRDRINYHNRQAWSPDGRYICLERSGMKQDSESEIWLSDLHTGASIKLDDGDSPRWANTHNWLFYKRSRPENGPSWGEGTEIMWLDVDSRKLTRIGFGISDLKYTDYQDRWLYGIQDQEGNEHVNGQGLQTRGRGVRLAIREDSRLEVLQWDGGYGYGSLYVNPGHPVILNRDHGFRQFIYATEGTEDVPFNARMQVDTDLEGRGATRTFPFMEGSHFSWSGDGDLFLCGNGQIRGRRWDEPLPSNIHFLATRTVGDVSPCSRSGRYICGSSHWGPIIIADLRSGDAWDALPMALSWRHDSKHYSYSTSSALHDNDAKGSADGTKIVFQSNYDLKNGPVTRLTGDVSQNRIPVASTAGFPDQGRLSVKDEVIGYHGKTATAFEGITRQLYNTANSRLASGDYVTSYEFRIIPEEERADLMVSSSALKAGEMYDEMPLAWQNQTDVYVIVVRAPDAPVLWEVDGLYELIPGENHYETFGYHLYRNGTRITDAPVQPGEKISLPGAGTYTATAIEWSGLISAKSDPLQIPDKASLSVLHDKPADFSWTESCWLVDGKEVPMAVAEKSPDAVEEIVHRYEGVAHRAWYSFGQKYRQHDLNRDGKPVRRCEFQNGHMSKRELHGADGAHVSTELFDPEGFITEQIQYSKGREISHWWYEKAEPVKHAGRGGRWGGDDDEMVIRVRQGEQWVLQSDLLDTIESRKIPR